MKISKCSINDSFTYCYHLRSRDLLSKTNQGIVTAYDFVDVLNMDTINLNYHTVICFEI